MFEELQTPPPRALPVALFRQLRRALLPLFLTGAGLLAVTAGANLIFYLQYREAARLARVGGAAEGTLVDKISGRFMSRLTVAYRASDRRMHSLRQWVRASAANRWVLIGDRVPIHYDPADPDHAALAELSTPEGSPARSLPAVFATALAALIGAFLLATAVKLLATLRRLLRQGTLATARLLGPAGWKNLWFAQYEVTHAEKNSLHRSFVPPGWRPTHFAASGADPRGEFAALTTAGRKRQAFLLIEPAPQDW